MTAEIHDLRSKIGREAYFNHLMRKMEGKTADQLHLEASILKIQALTMERTAEWMENYFAKSISESSSTPNPEDIAAFQDAMMRNMLRSALDTLTLDTSDVEKFMGPDWNGKF